MKILFDIPDPQKLILYLALLAEHDVNMAQESKGNQEVAKRYLEEADRLGSIIKQIESVVSLPEPKVGEERNLGFGKNAVLDEIKDEQAYYHVDGDLAGRKMSLKAFSCYPLG